MPGQDGDGWVRCGRGHRHWGRFGAVGLLARAGPGLGKGPAPDGPDETDRVLLVERSWWSHHGGTWGTPGGARDSDETPLAAAQREAWEECGLPPDEVTVTALLDDDHGGWSYQTFLATAAGQPPVRAASAEITEARWVDVAEVTSLPLHPGFAEQWPLLRAALVPVTVIVDAANVMGSRPDGWWRDRAGAARRLVSGVTALAGSGVTVMPAGLALPSPARWLPDYVVVLEGQARAAVPEGPGLDGSERVRVVGAPGSGDDAIAELAGSVPGRRLVVTADRELRGRCERAGAAVTGPRWLTERLDD